MESLRLFILMTRPWFLIGPMVGYALGAGIAHYLGTPIDWTAYVLGQAWVSLMQMTTHYLNEYYNAPADQVNENRTPFSGGSGMVGPGRLPRRVAQLAAMTTLAILASLTVLLIQQLNPPSGVFFILGLAFLGAFFYSSPPIRLEASGYGELTTSVLVAVLVPALGFLLQTGDMHRLIVMVAFPSFAAHLAMLLALELPDYTNDEKFEKHTLMVRLGWQNGMFLHNVLILIAILLIPIAFVLGFPWFATLAGLAGAPLGIFQIFQMRNIAAGGAVNWLALTTGGVAFFTVMVYLFALAFWTY
jgi:1,4-dihydroxy-2-naphthoate polyprenyltransferase